MKPRGEVKIVGLFSDGDEVGGESLNGRHGAVLFCCPDEAAAIGKMLYTVVDLVPAGAVEKAHDAVVSIGDVASDLKNQRDARDEENRRLRAHVAALLRALGGKAKRREVTHICIAAQRELEQPLRAVPHKSEAGK